MIRNWALGVLGLSSLTAFGAATTSRPGTLSFIEGQAAIDGRAAPSRSAGSIAAEQGQVVSTGSGRVEVLLTPGVFLRLGENSEARIDAAGLTDTRIRLLRGRAYIDADNLRDENRIRVFDDRAAVQPEKNGLYRIDADRDTVSVFDGKALVSQNDQQVEVKEGREVNLNGALTPQKFDKKAEQKADSLYQWSKLRSDYIDEANQPMVATYSNPWGPWSYGPGFYSPWYGSGFGAFGPSYYYGPVYRYRAPIIRVRPVPRPGFRRHR